MQARLEYVIENFQNTLVHRKVIVLPVCYSLFLDEEAFLALLKFEENTKVTLIKEFIKKRNAYRSNPTNRVMKMAYYMSYRAVKAHIQCLATRCQIQYDKLERDHFRTTHTLADQNLSAKYTRNIKLCQRYLTPLRL